MLKNILGIVRFICKFASNNPTMFEFQQYLGFLAFLTIVTIGFWLLIFLLLILPYWIGGAVMDLLKEKRQARKTQETS